MKQEELEKRRHLVEEIILKTKYSQKITSTYLYEQMKRNKISSYQIKEILRDKLNIYIEFHNKKYEYLVENNNIFKKQDYEN